MSQAKIKPHISTSEKIRAQSLITETIKETRAAHGRAVVGRYGRFLVGVGFALGVIFTAVGRLLYDAW